MRRRGRGRRPRWNDRRRGPATTSAAAALMTRRSRSSAALGSPPRTRADVAVAFSRRRRRRRRLRSGEAWARPKSAGARTTLGRRRRRLTSQAMGGRGRRQISSRPSSEWTTRARSMPRRASAPQRSSGPRCARADACRAARAGVAGLDSGPRRLKAVRTPSSRRAPGRRGAWRGGSAARRGMQKPQAFDDAGAGGAPPRSTRAPSASRTSALPHLRRWRRGCRAWRRGLSAGRERRSRRRWRR
ncbi:MAG: hypothetical protein KatS3mg064_1784 [Tepidiforma sp.]|nr:MAG: hypothetical protein KatS3mg064_1784 [Tepidiforma sp.]